MVGKADPASKVGDAEVNRTTIRRHKLRIAKAGKTNRDR